jgi:hypothetical protein
VYATGTTLLTLFKVNNDGGAWTRVTADLTPCHGRKFTRRSAVHLEDAVPADDTWMRLDDVAIANG